MHKGFDVVAEALVPQVRTAAALFGIGFLELSKEAASTAGTEKAAETLRRIALRQFAAESRKRLCDGANPTAERELRFE